MTITEQTRLEAWNAVRARCGMLHDRILQDLRMHGPSTTRRVAESTFISILTVRPRMTELAQLGLVEAVDRNEDGAIYQAVPEWKAAEAWNTARAKETETQARLFD